LSSALRTSLVLAATVSYQIAAISMTLSVLDAFDGHLTIASL